MRMFPVQAHDLFEKQNLIGLPKTKNISLIQSLRPKKPKPYEYHLIVCLNYYEHLCQLLLQNERKITPAFLHNNSFVLQTHEITFVAYC